MSVQPEIIGDTDTLSRHVWAPRMYNSGEDAFRWQIVFEFPDGQGESLFWHKYIDLSGVHAAGCGRQENARASKPDTTYTGAVSAIASGVRNYRNPHGHGFRLEHEPSQGRAHAHICYDAAKNVPMTKADKNELKVALGNIFSQFHAHRCA